METVHVRAGRPYDVCIGDGLLSRLGDMLRERHPVCRAALVSDATVYALYGKAAKESLARAGFDVREMVIPPGEASKSLDTYGELLRFFASQALTQSDIAVALGGGMVGDVTGFAAASYLRGISYIQVPTTLLSAVDASVGGKTAVNLPQGKNLVGAFWQPTLVVCDLQTFATLPRAIFLEGVAESLKYGMLCDRSLFDEIAGGGLDRDLIGIVARCVSIKENHVAKDERDQGLRQMLNFGHTIAHALEKLSDFSISHGYAVAIGMAGMTRIAASIGVCDRDCEETLLSALNHLGLPSKTHYPYDSIVDVALMDKKRRGDAVTLVMPESVGRCVLKSFPVADLPQMFRCL